MANSTRVVFTRRLAPLIDQPLDDVLAALYGAMEDGGMALFDAPKLIAVNPHKVRYLEQVIPDA